MADTVIENLITQLSFEVDDEQLDKFDDFIVYTYSGDDPVASINPPTPGNPQNPSCP